MMCRQEYFDMKETKQKQIDMAKRCMKTIIDLYLRTPPDSVSECREYFETYYEISQVIIRLYENGGVI